MWDPSIDEYLTAEERMTKWKFDTRYGIWTQKNGQIIKLKDMTLSHLRNTKNYLLRKRSLGPSEIIDDWIEAFEKEIASRENLPPRKVSK